MRCSATSNRRWQPRSKRRGYRERYFHELDDRRTRTDPYDRRIWAFYGDKVTPVIEKFGIALLAVAAIAILSVAKHAEATTFGGAFVFDAFAAFFKFICFAAAGIALALAPADFSKEGGRGFEYAVLILLSAVGMGVMISARDFIMLYLGLELQSLSLYILTAIRRDSLRATEAGLKYFVLGALSSGMLLYGISLIYGFTGATGFAEIAAAVHGKALSTGLIFGLVFMLAGFAFKLSAVPFHMWAPDVYEGAPTPVAAFIASAPKLAASAMLLRVLFEALPEAAPAWQQIITFISIASMALGAFAAIGQTNIKRLLAYSSIGHIGFMLLGLAGASEDGVRSVLIYMTIYAAMTLGSFALVLAMRDQSGKAVEEIDALSGYAKTNPLPAFMFAMLLFSLAGIPPLAGFFAKYFVFMAAVKAHLYALAVIGVISSVVGAYYYLRIVKLMYFDEPKGEFAPMAAEQRLVLYAGGACMLLFLVWPSALMNAIFGAAASLF
jgi:NADH-quinone oxidoreductase subunit N